MPDSARAIKLQLQCSRRILPRWLPHATTRLASFLWTEGACLVALWLVGCPRAAEAACGVILLQVDLAAVLRVGALGKIDSALGCPAAQDGATLLLLPRSSALRARPQEGCAKYI